MPDRVHRLSVDYSERPSVLLDAVLLIEFALAESRQQRSGAKCVLLRLSEVLFVEVVRRYLDALPAGQTNWLAGLRDPIVGHALALLHDRPTASWTQERLAKDVGVSRSALADRFTQFVGQPPMRYLAHWRMQLAARLLSDGAANRFSLDDRPSGSHPIDFSQDRS